MADLIDRQAAIDAVKEYGAFMMEYSDDMSKEEIAEEAIRSAKSTMLWILKELPSAEPEIVRCKDCKYYNPIGVCIEMSSAVCEDSFCCWAERRIDE